MIVLGIDPGLARTGYGIIQKSGDLYSAVDYGCIATPAGLDLPKRLLIIFNSLKHLISQFSPDAAAVEKLFFCRNVRTATQVGEARGTVLTAAAEKDLPLYEYTPLQVKQAVVGYGRAHKKEVQKMICLLLGSGAMPGPDDISDALAVAICHLHSHNWSMLIEKESKKTK